MMFKIIPKEDRARYRKEQRFFISLATAFGGWMFLFTILLVIGFIFAWSYIPALEPNTPEKLFLSDLIPTIVLIFITTHLVLKKRVRNGQLVLAEGITFRHFRNKVFIHCLWASLLIRYSISFLLTIAETFIHLKAGTSVMSIVIPAYVFMYICQRYHKKYYTIPAFLPIQPVQDESAPLGAISSREEKLAMLETYVQQQATGRKSAFIFEYIYDHKNKKPYTTLMDAASKESHIKQIADFFIQSPTLIWGVPYSWVVLECLVVPITFIQTSNFILAAIALPLVHGIMRLVFFQVQAAKIKSLVKTFQTADN